MFSGGSKGNSGKKTVKDWLRVGHGSLSTSFLLFLKYDIYAQNILKSRDLTYYSLLTSIILLKISVFWHAGTNL